MFPWAYFVQEIPVTGEWNEIELPFSGFTSENMLPSVLNTGKIVSVAIVAAKKDFAADIQLSRLELY
jgi:hypothetical protein